MITSRYTRLSSLVVRVVKAHATVGSIAAVTAGLVVATVGMPFSSNRGVNGTPVVWSGLPKSDPSSLEDGYEHWIVTFANPAAAEGSTTAPIQDGVPAADPVLEGKVIRIPLQLNESGEVATSELLRIADQGELLRIVSDGKSAFAEVVVGNSAKEAADSGHKSDGDGASSDVDADNPAGAESDALAELIREVPGTKDVTLVMPGVYAVVTTAGIDKYKDLAGVVDVDEDIVLSVAGTDTKKTEQETKQEAKKSEQETKKTEQETKKTEQEAKQDSKKSEQDAKKESKKSEQDAKKESKKSEQDAKKDSKKSDKDSKNSDLVQNTSTRDPRYSEQWALNNTGAVVNGNAGTPGADIGIEDAWVVSQGIGQVVAIVDTGVDMTHPDLANSIWKNPGEICGNGKDDESNGYIDDCNGWDFANNDASVFDPESDNRHATHLAGIIAAGTNNGIGVAGIAPGAKIMSVKSGNGNSFRLSDGARGIAYAAANGATVINCSFGTPAGTPIDAVSTMSSAIDQARAKGIVVVVAAGNDGRNIDSSPTYPASFPQDNIVTVGSTTNSDAQSSFSNWGPNSVDLHAPGSDILSTLPGGSYGGMSGTSMAAPMVAGSVALIRSAMPALSPTEVRALLMGSSTSVNSLAGYSGSGRRLDIGAILNDSSATSSEPARFSFDGFGSAQEGSKISASVRSSVDANAVTNGSNVAVRATLLTSFEGVAHGVVGASVLTDQGTLETDDQASVVLSPTEGFAPTKASGSMQFGFSLPAGDYVLVAEAYTTKDDATLGRPWAVFFTVAAKGQLPPDPLVAPVPAAGGGSASSPGSSPSPSSSPGATPAPTGSQPSVGGGATGGSQSPSVTGSNPVSVPGASGSSGTSSGGSSTTELPSGGSWVSSPAPLPSSGGTSWDWYGPKQLPTNPSSEPLPLPKAPVAYTWTPSPTPSGAGTSPTSPDSTIPSSSASTPNLPPVPAPVTSGSLTISAINPRLGSIDGNELVLIDGNGFRPTLYVRFGTRSARVVAMSSTQIAVVTPSHVVGVSDLTVAISGGDSVTMANAFTFIDPASVSTPLPTPSSSSGSGGGGTTPGTSPQPGSPSPSVGGSQPAPDSSQSPQPSPATTITTEPALPTVLPTRFTFGAEVAGPSGMRLRPVVGISPLSRFAPSGWSTKTCRLSSCQGTRLR